MRRLIVCPHRDEARRRAGENTDDTTVYGWLYRAEYGARYDEIRIDVPADLLNTGHADAYLEHLRCRLAPGGTWIQP